MLPLLLLAFLARAWELGRKSLWLDEGISVHFARPDLPEMLRILIERDLHPPLYYLVLHYWMLAAGTSEFAVRFPSVVAGMLLVPLLYRFARQLYPGWPGRATGLLAAALAAASPFLIYYAQEARMYGPLAVAGLAATLALRRALAEGRPRWWAIYAVVLATAPYLHHFGWMVVVVHGAFVGLTIGQLRLRALGWIASVGVVVLLYLPWLQPALRQALRLRDTPDFWQGTLTFWYVAQRVFAGFAVGFGGAFEQYGAPLVLFLLAFAAGAVALIARALISRRTGDLLVVIYLVVPLMIVYALVARNPKFADRYLIVALPPFLILLARGVVGLGEVGLRLAHRAPALGAPLIAVAVAVAVGMTSVSVGEGARVYGDDRYAKDDNRSALDHMIRNWQEGDAALLMLDTYQVFDYYSHGRLKRYGLNPTDDLEFAAGELNKIVANGHPRLWVLMWNPDWADPSGNVRALLDETAEQVPNALTNFHGLTLRLYSLRDRPHFSAHPTPQRSFDVRFGDAVRLVGADIGAENPSRRRIALYWDPLRTMGEDLAVSLRLRRDGHEWWRFDGRPAAHTYPTMSWRPGRQVRGTFALQVPAGTPPGEYELSLVVYDARTLNNLPVEHPGAAPGDRSLTIGKVVVVSPPPIGAAELPIPRWGPAALGGLDLIGVHVPLGRAQSGAPLELATAWRLAGDPDDRLIDVWLVDAAGARWHLDAQAPDYGRYPVSAWRQGEIVVDRRTLALPPGAAAGAAKLEVAVRRPGESAEGAARVEVATVELSSRPRVTTPPDPQQPADARFGEVARLVGVDAPRVVDRGGMLPVRLHWQATDGTTTSYAVFVHVVDSSERPVAQRDGAPGGGALPTTSWIPGEYLRDEHEVAIAASVPPGEYRLAVGMYDARTGQRLPVQGPRGREPGDRLILGPVEVR